jgi:hypothetical protein
MAERPLKDKTPEELEQMILKVRAESVRLNQTLDALLEEVRARGKQFLSEQAERMRRRDSN